VPLACRLPCDGDDLVELLSAGLDHAGDLLLVLRLEKVIDLHHDVGGLDIYQNLAPLPDKQLGAVLLNDQTEIVNRRLAGVGVVKLDDFVVFGFADHFLVSLGCYYYYSIPWENVKYVLRCFLEVFDDEGAKKVWCFTLIIWYFW